MREYLFLITDNYPFGLGEEFLQNEIEELSKNFKKVYLITSNIKDNQTKSIPINFEIYRIEKSLSKLFNILKKEYISDFFSKDLRIKDIKNKINFIYLGELIREKIEELIKRDKLVSNEITLYSYWFYGGAYGISKIKSKDIIKVSRAHGYDLYFERGPQFLKNKILDNIDKVLSCSKMGSEYLKEKYKQYENKIEYSYLGTNGIETLKYKNNNFHLISCSYVRPLKRLTLIVETLKKLESKNIFPNIIWTHIGDGEDLEKIRNLSKELKYVKVNFLGHMDNKEILKYYEENNIKCFISLSATEGLPVSMMEAQSFGIPIIATNVGGVGEIVNNDIGILLDKDSNVDEIAYKIEKILKLSNEEYMKYQKNSYDNWNNKFNAKKNYTEFIEKYLK